MKQLVHPEWVRRLNLFGDVAGDPRSIVELDADELLAVARAAPELPTRASATGRGGTRRTAGCCAPSTPNPVSTCSDRVITRGEVLRILRTWLRLQDAWDRTPQILAEPVEAPIFVVGPPRSGTTILFELLALDPQFRSPYAWEALAPLPLVTDDPVADRARRLELAECEQEFWADIHPEFMTMHELASDLPCECVNFLAYDFAGPYWSMLYDTPSFTGWQLEHLEVLAARLPAPSPHVADVPVRQCRHGHSHRWLLKSPGHLQTLPQLFAEYPDARVIHTHRDPNKFIASLVSLLAVLRFTRSDHVDVAALGPMMELTYQMFLEQVIAERSDGTIPNERVVDSHFLDLMADPVAALRKIYDGLEVAWPAGHDDVVSRYLAEKPKGKHGTHAYTYADVGLDEDHVRATFEGYVAAYGITLE